ncbi:MAG: Uma2 family endonuclease [Gloeomargarita sp. GXS_bins_116]
MVAPVPVYLPPQWRFGVEQFQELVRANPELRLTGRQNARFLSRLEWWNEQTQLGMVFSTGFPLSNGAIRSPDVAWVPKASWDALTPAEKAGFAPLCPDFVIERVSPSDDTALVQTKMQEYRDNGCRLGWLILPANSTVVIYHASQVLAAPG